MNGFHWIMKLRRRGSLPIGPALLAMFLGADRGGAQDERWFPVDYFFTEPQLVGEGLDAVIRVADCQGLKLPGQPEVPCRTARILLPPGYRLTGIEAEPGSGSKTLPAEWYSAKGVGEEGRVPGAGGTAILRGGRPGCRWPVPPVELHSVQRMDDYSIAVARLHPVQYRPDSDRLVFTPRLRVTLRVEKAEGFVAGSLPAVVNRPHISQFVDNPQAATLYHLRDGKVQKEAEEGSELPCRYLLVTSADLLPAFEPLLDQKHRCGLETRVETIERIRVREAGRDIQEKIRNCIRRAHSEWGVQYVLLGGDTSTIPCRYAYVPMNEKESECHLPSDLYYACLDGSWNRDGDGRWAESTDGDDGDEVDLLADVWVGRAPVDTAEEATAFVEKTLRYATQGHRNPASVLVAAEYLGRFSPDVHAQGGRILDPVRSLLQRYSLRQLDDRPRLEPQWTRSDALAALNRGPHLVFACGHADSEAVMRLATGDAAALSNQDPFLLCSVGCHAGRFDNNAFSPDCIAEEMVKRKGAGAFAALINSRLGWFDPEEEWKYSGEFQLRLVRLLLGESPVPVGKALGMARHDLLGQVEQRGSSMPYRWCYFELTLLGDPHANLQLPTALPLAPNGRN